MDVNGLLTAQFRHIQLTINLVLGKMAKSFKVHIMIGAFKDKMHAPGTPYPPP